jgi:hypothetical protein
MCLITSYTSDGSEEDEFHHCLRVYIAAAYLYLRCYFHFAIVAFGIFLDRRRGTEDNQSGGWGRTLEEHCIPIVLFSFLLCLGSIIGARSRFRGLLTRKTSTASRLLVL